MNERVPLLSFPVVVSHRCNLREHSAVENKPTRLLLSQDLSSISFHFLLVESRVGITVCDRLLAVKAH